MRLINRIKILIALVQEMGGQVAARDLDAYLFLLCHEHMENNHYYDFIPQVDGPHSLQALADKTVLINKKCLDGGDDWGAKDGLERFATSLDFFEKIALQDLKNNWQGKPSDDLHAYLKANHSDYFTDTQADKSSGNDENIQFFTIGYEGLSPEAYLNKLIASDVKLLCDVRKNAFSQKYGFSKSELKSLLGKVGIEYQHIPQLGIVYEKRQSLNTDKDYKALFEEYESQTLANEQAALDLLMGLLNEHKRIAITCFEAEAHHCHRSRVAKALSAMEDFPCKVRHL